MTSRKLAFALVCAFVASGCGMMKNLDEMHDSTVKMSETTGGMSDTTTKMADTTGNLYSVTSYTYFDLRLSGAATLRTDQIRALKESRGPEAKAIAAATLFNAFEFQLWKDFGADTPEAREKLFVAGVKEFWHRWAEFADRENTKNYTDVNPANEDEDSLNRYSLAITSHQVSDHQIVQADVRGFEPVTMQQLIEEGIDAGYRLSQYKTKNADLKEHEAVASLEWRKKLYFLQVRMNRLAAMALAKISHVEEGLLPKVIMYLFSWQGCLGNQTETELLEWTKWLQEANRTAAVISKYTAPTVDSAVKKIYMHFDAQKSLEQRTKIALPGDRLINQAAKNLALEGLVKEIEKFKTMAGQN